MATKKAVATKKKAPAKKSAAKATSVKETKTTVKTVTATAKKKQSLSQRLENSLLTGSLWRALGAEFLGTFLLASVVIAGQGQPIFILFGLVGIVLLFGSVSGSHVNPAVTVAAWATRRIGWLRALGYILAQVLGAAAAFFALSAFVGGAVQPTAEQQMYGQTAASLFQATDIGALTGKEWYIFFAELLGTVIFGYAVASAARAKETVHAALATGLGIFIALMVAITASGYVSASAILNPAVALSLQAYGANAWSFIVYALAPIVGGVLGYLLHDLIRGRDRA